MNETVSKWIPVGEKMPEEHNSMFARWKGTDKWQEAMFEKISNKVNVTIEFNDGNRITDTLYTIDGKWKDNYKAFKGWKVIAWCPLPEPYERN